MFKKTIKYTDFNGTERSENFYFHMSLPEMARLEAKCGGKTVPGYVKQLVADQDVEEIIRFIEEIVLTSYGKKSDDGKQFLKSKVVREEFEYSQAYAELFEELFTVDGAAEKFAYGISTQTKAFKKPEEDTTVINLERE